MKVKYLVIEVFETEDSVDCDELYDEIVEILGGGCEYSTDQSNLYYLLQRCAEDMDRVKVLQIGNPDSEDE